jgi:hypothetical protein
MLDARFVWSPTIDGMAACNRHMGGTSILAPRSWVATAGHVGRCDAEERQSEAGGSVEYPVERRLIDRLREHHDSAVSDDDVRRGEHDRTRTVDLALDDDHTARGPHSASVSSSRSGC